MSQKKFEGYCSQCSCWCPVVSVVRDNVFVEVKPDKQSPLECGICPKALAGPELVYHKDRLKYPMRRTTPKSDPDPGWERITWDEALDTIAERLNAIKDRFGPESVAIARSGPSGSPMGELNSCSTGSAMRSGRPTVFPRPISASGTATGDPHTPLGISAGCIPPPRRV